MLLEALIRHFLELDKGLDRRLTEQPTWNRFWQACGLKDLANRYPVKLVNLSTSSYRELKWNGIPVDLRVFWQCGIVINIGKYKTHGLVGFTGALKNLYGLVPA